jgi:dihydroneopterin aldolase
MDSTRIADAARGLRHVFLHDLLLTAAIGVYAQEHGRTQRIRVNVDLGVTDDGARGLSRVSVGRDDLARVVDYAAVAETVRKIVGAGHVQLVETLAERLAEACLDDPRVQLARVRVEKLDVLPDGASAGVEVERRRQS